MPEWAVREMMADWLGAGRAYNGRWPDVHNWMWLSANLPKIRVHQETRNLIIKVLSELQEYAHKRRMD